MTQEEQKSQWNLKDIVDRFNILENIFVKGGIALVGYRAAERLGAPGWSGALSSLVAYRLSQSPSEIAGAAGTAGLAGIGVANLDAATSALPGIFPQQDPSLKDRADPTGFYTALDWYYWWFQRTP